MASDLPEPARQVLEWVGPEATVGEVLERSSLGELETRTCVAELLESGWLRPTGAQRAAEVPSHERRLEARIGRDELQHVVRGEQPLSSRQVEDEQARGVARREQPGI